jgi:hypothetical protein
MRRQCPQCKRTILALKGTAAADGWCIECGARLPEPEPEQAPALSPLIAFLRSATSVAEISQACQKLRQWLIASPDDDGPRYCQAALALPILHELWNAMRRLGGPVPPSPALAQRTEAEMLQAQAAMLLQEDSRVHPEEVLHAIDLAVGWCDGRGVPTPTLSPRAPEEPVESIRVGPDHRSCHWGTEEFSFTPTQAADDDLNALLSEDDAINAGHATQAEARRTEAERNARIGAAYQELREAVEALHRDLSEDLGGLRPHEPDWDRHVQRIAKAIVNACETWRGADYPDPQRKYALRVFRDTMHGASEEQVRERLQAAADKKKREVWRWFRDLPPTFLWKPPLEEAAPRPLTVGEYYGGQTNAPPLDAVRPAGENGDRSPQQPVEGQTSPSLPTQYLLNWREILAALDLNNNAENQRRVRQLNEKFAGPIALPGQGGQPRVSKGKLVSWWNGLEERFQEIEQKEANTEATLQAQHDYGRAGTVLPDISGHVKKRRRKKRHQ